MKDFEVGNVVMIAILCNILMTYLQFINFKRQNFEFGISDFYLNMLIMFFGKAATFSFSILPMTIMLTYVTPKNVEASMFAILSASLTFNVEWGGDLVGALVCKFFKITDENMTNFD
jgi:hypothetical protein